MDDDHDLGDAAEYIGAERPRISDDDIWAVLRELGEPPAAGAEPLAIDFVVGSHPAVRRRDVEAIIREWRAFRDLESAPNWDDLDD